MNTNSIQLLDELLKKYKIKHPVPKHFRDHIRKNKKKSLIKIYKKLGKSNILFSTTITIFFFFRNIGMGISLVKSALVLFAGSVMVISSLSAGSYIAVKHVFNKKDHPYNIKEIQPPAPIIELKQGQGSVQEKVILLAKEVGHIIIFTEFKSNTVKAETAKKITAGIKNRVLQIFYKRNIHKSKNYIMSATSKYILIGRIDRAGGYTITAKLLERKNFSIIHIATEKIQTIKEIKIACKKIAETITKYI